LLIDRDFEFHELNTALEHSEAVLLAMLGAMAVAGRSFVLGKNLHFTPENRKLGS